MCLKWATKSSNSGSSTYSSNRSLISSSNIDSKGNCGSNTREKKYQRKVMAASNSSSSKDSSSGSSRSSSNCKKAATVATPEEKYQNRMMSA